MTLNGGRETLVARTAYLILASFCFISFTFSSGANRCLTEAFAEIIPNVMDSSPQGLVVSALLHI